MNTKFEQFLELTKRAWGTYLEELTLSGRTLNDKVDEALYKKYKKRANGVVKELNSS